MKKSASRNKPRSNKALVLGIGNLLVGDEGIGVLAVRHLMTTDLAGEADFVDGGTGGFHLLSYFQEYPRIMLIDAAADGKPPGTVSVLKPRFASDFPKSLTAHDIGLKDLIEAAVLLGQLPEIDLITVSIEDPQAVTLEVSKTVKASLPKIEEKVRTLLRRSGR